MQDEILWLVADGKLPPEIVNEASLEQHQRPVLRAMAHCLARGEETPLYLPTVWAVARTRYHGGEDTKSFLRALDRADFAPTVLNSVQDSLILRTVVEQSQRQLADGSFDLIKLRELLSVPNTTQNFVQRVAVPTKAKEERYPLQTNIAQLDAQITGLRSELIVVAARPKSGKSTFFFNIIWKNPKKKIIYFTVADYDYEDTNFMLAAIDPKINQRKNLLIADGTSHIITPMDVEAIVSKYRPDLVIVDRAEVMVTQRQRRVADTTKREELSNVFSFLRRLAKQYNVPILTDAQLSAEDERSRYATMSNMAEDKTGRQAVLDLFIGLRRRRTGTLSSDVTLYIEGRRHGLPEEITIQTDEVGRYLGRGRIR